MHMIVCIDNRRGMMFNHRRQSKDRVVIADIINALGSRRLWIHRISADIFPADGSRIAISDRAPQGVAPEDCCFVEDYGLRPYLSEIRTITIYKWNRDYPSDFQLDMDPTEEGFQLLECTEFAGYSHERITKEVYGR